MFKFKGFINSNSTTPTLLRYDLNEDNAMLEHIAPGTALYRIGMNGGFVRCSNMHRPTHICQSVETTDDGKMYMICYLVTENMLFEAPFTRDENVWEDMYYGAKLCVDGKSNSQKLIYRGPEEQNWSATLIFCDELNEDKEENTCVVCFNGINT